NYSGTGISTCCPSVTPFGLTLGPTNPGTIIVAQETLVLWRTGFSPVLSLLMPTFSLLYTPPDFPVQLHCSIERSPTTPRIAYTARIFNFKFIIFNLGVLWTIYNHREAIPSLLIVNY